MAKRALVGCWVFFAWHVVCTPDSTTLQAGDDSPVTILMSTGNGLWNTGVWSGYGDFPTSTLRWASEGVVVDKSLCTPLQRGKCRVVQQQGLNDPNVEASADVIVMETVNHPKFLQNRADSVPFPFPARSQQHHPLLGMFYYEPSSWYPNYTTNTEFAKQFDFVLAPREDAQIPTTMVCGWGFPTSAFFTPPTLSRPYLIAYFSDGGLDPYFQAWVQGLVGELGGELHAFGQFKNVPNAPTSLTPAQKIELMRSYHFVLVTETIALEDWVSSEWSQSLLAGSIPVYIGAPNINKFAPSESSFVHIRDWITQHPQKLAQFLRQQASSPESLRKMLQWREDGPGAPSASNFMKRLGQCVFDAECRICELALKMLGRA